ncbi:aspartyl/glutamyl-tRNA(Asn/Gln) amidotransferase subunit A [Blastococcus aggregatus]|uniref:Aspartyl/glutamyl-tRNA(Asn/Gln) amidotransferase subunit A n=1 Tax=Blastococcus aggregatus TaxID=38502 RepID=A0A285V8B0_9ACTN|nr:amidase [Blastococcus aggregatus]SOC50310.1 aspartyl/glutamyl-tRNA(Asn/Gln) amidotransferase subunit A [Blastococcus aggregatus]
MQPFELSLSAAATEISARRLSPVELTDSVLARIEATEPRLGAFAHVTDELARKAAAHAEQEIASGRYLGALHGIPLGVKDLYDTAGVPTTSSSAVRAGVVPDTDSASVEQLLGAGMVMVGKTHTHEFAFGGITPTTRNPWDPGRIPGGSSGGSGAAVAAGSCMVGMGSDTAGSIRIPATLCGTVGLKPTYGRASRRGVASLAWSLDHVGPLTRNVTDCAHVLNAIAGYDRRDPASVDVPVPDHTAGLDDGIAGLRIGVPSDYFFEHVSEDVEQAVRTAIDVLAGLGAELREVSTPYAEQILATEWAIVYPEASAYHQKDLRAKAELYLEDTRLSLEVGELVLATDYIKALRIRTLMQRARAEVFDDVDLVVMPGMPFAAPAVGATEVTWSDGVTEAISSALIRLTSPGNLTGQPVLSVPVGFDAAGLPLGMQLTGRPFDEATVLRAGRAYEQVSDAVGRIAPVG